MLSGVIANMPSLKSVKSHILRTTTKRQTSTSVSSSASDVSGGSTPKVTRKKSGTLKNRLKSGLKKPTGNRKGLPESTSSLSSFDLEKLDNLQAQIEELRRDLKEKDENLSQRDNLVSDLVYKMAKYENMLSSGDDEKCPKSSSGTITQLTQDEVVQEPGNSKNRKSKTPTKKQEPTELLLEIDSLKSQVKRNKRLIAIQKTEIEKLEKEKEGNSSSQSETRISQFVQTDPIFVHDQAPEFGVNNSGFETANENSMVSYNISWHSNEPHSSSPLQKNVSTHCEIIKEEMAKEQELLIEASDLRTKLCELESLMENAIESKVEFEKLLIMTQEAILCAFQSFYPKYQLPEKIPINDQIVLKLVLCEFNSLVLNFVNESAQAKKEVKKLTKSKVGKQNEKLKKELARKNDQIEALEIKLMNFQEMYCKMLGKFGF